MTEAAQAEPPTIPEWTVGDRIRKARRHGALSQDDLADALTAAGIRASSRAVASWEAGNTRPRDIVRVAKVIESATGVSAAWVAGLVDERFQRTRRSGPLGVGSVITKCRPRSLTPSLTPVPIGVAA